VSRIVTINGKARHVGGRRRPLFTPKTHPHMFKTLRPYMGPSLPTAPSSFDYTTAAKAALEDILGNDRLGDCTAAGACHIVDAITAAAGAPAVLTAQDAIGFYSLSTGYNPADPSTDQGGDEYTVLSTWKDKGIDGKGAHAIAGFVAIDPSNADFVKSVAWLFENLYFGIELADAWTSTPNGGVWDVGQAPDPNDGHCVVGLGGSPAGIVVDTWGEFITITWAAIAEFCGDGAGGQLFCVLTPEIISRAQQKSPNGLDWEALVADFNALANPVPPSVPPTPVGPAPSGPLGPAA
jgi:hypothetical protein